VKQDPPPPSPGAATVAAVLQNEVARVIADPKTPEPEKHEVIPPPTSSEMPERGLTPAKPEPADQPVTGDDQADSKLNEEPPKGEPIIHIPNVFSPNNDGINDKLEVSATGVGGRVVVRVFSAKTEALVFTSSDVETSWDGRDLRGTPCDEGFYFYAIELVGEDGRTYTKGETVRLYRQ
jgi:gliding motility-associated-like protein